MAISVSHSSAMILSLTKTGNHGKMNNIDHLLELFNKKTDDLNKRIDEHFTDAQLEIILDNVINSKITKHLADRINDLLNIKMRQIIDRQISEISELPIIIKHEISKYIHSVDFERNMNFAIMSFFNKRFGIDEMEY